MLPNGEKSPIATIIIPAYNCRNTIKACLDSISAQNTQKPYEIVVVDSSSDSTISFVKEHFSHVKVIHSKTRLFPAAARNLGTELAKGDFLLFLDGDCIAHSDWIERMLSRLQEGYWGVGGSVSLVLRSNAMILAHQLLEFFHFLPRKRVRRSAKFIISGNCGYKRSVFDKAKFPDVKIGEDRFFSYCLAKSGKEIIFDPTISVQHKPCLSSNEIWFRQYSLGMTAAWLSAHADLGGRMFIRFPVFSIFLPFINIVKIAIELMLCSFRYFLPFILLGPICFLLNTVWTIGFLRGIKAVKAKNSL